MSRDRKTAGAGALSRSEGQNAAGSRLARARAALLADSRPVVPHRLYTTMEAGAYLRISDDQVAKLTDCGQLDSVFIGYNRRAKRKHIRILGASILAFIEKRKGHG